MSPLWEWVFAHPFLTTGVVVTAISCVTQMVNNLFRSLRRPDTHNHFTTPSPTEAVHDPEPDEPEEEEEPDEPEEDEPEPAPEEVKVRRRSRFDRIRSSRS